MRRRRWRSGVCCKDEEIGRKPLREVEGPREMKMKHKVRRDKSRGETGSLRKKLRKQVRRRKTAKETDEEQGVTSDTVSGSLAELLPSQRGHQSLEASHHRQNGKYEKDNCQCEQSVHTEASPQEQ